MPMSPENRERARARFRAMNNARRLAAGKPLVDYGARDAIAAVPVEDKEAEPECPALILEIELNDNQLGALTLDSRCKGLSVHDTILAVINQAYGL